jgi:hypothetical protein
MTNNQTADALDEPQKSQAGRNDNLWKMTVPRVSEAVLLECRGECTGAEF